MECVAVKILVSPIEERRQLFERGPINRPLHILEFRVLGFSSRVSSFNFRVSGIGFRVSIFGFRASDFNFRVSGIEFQSSGFG
jgi:hypothetical protein